MFNWKRPRYSENALEVLSLAQSEARRLNHRYIGTEHLLLGLIRCGAGPAAEMFGKSGIAIGAGIVVYYSWPADLILLISLFRFPRRAGDVRFASILTGIGLLVSFLVASYSCYVFPRI